MDTAGPYEGLKAWMNYIVRGWFQSCRDELVVLPTSGAQFELSSPFALSAFLSFYRSRAASLAQARAGKTHRSAFTRRCTPGEHAKRPASAPLSTIHVQQLSDCHTRIVLSSHNVGPPLWTRFSPSLPPDLRIQHHLAPGPRSSTSPSAC